MDALIVVVIGPYREAEPGARGQAGLELNPIPEGAVDARVQDLEVRLLGETRQAFLAAEPEDLISGLQDPLGQTIAGGTTEIQKGIIATRGLGLPRG